MSTIRNMMLNEPDGGVGAFEFILFGLLVVGGGYVIKWLVVFILWI